MTKLPTKKTILTLISDIVILLIAIGVFSGSAYHIDSMQTDLNNKQVELEDEQLFNSSLQGIKSSLTASATNVAIFESYFIGKNETIKFFDSLERIARENETQADFSIIGDLVPVENANAKLSTIELRVMTTGSFENTISFYQDLSVSEKFLLLKDFSIQRSAVGDNELSDSGETIPSLPIWTSSATVTAYQSNN
jgi:hypothetical protein